MGGAKERTAEQEEEEEETHATSVSQSVRAEERTERRAAGGLAGLQTDSVAFLFPSFSPPPPTVGRSGWK